MTYVSYGNNINSHLGSMHFKRKIKSDECEFI